MVLRLASPHIGPMVQVLPTADHIDVKFLNSRHEYISEETFRSGFEIGRACDRPGPRCNVPCDQSNVKIVSRAHASILHVGGFWVWPGGDPARLDPMRLKSTWLLLSPQKAYLLPSGVRDGCVCLWSGQDHGFRVEVRNQPLTEPHYHW